MAAGNPRKLTEKEIISIRKKHAAARRIHPGERRLAAGELQEIAKLYGVSSSLILAIVSGDIYAQHGGPTRPRRKLKSN